MPILVGDKLPEAILRRSGLLGPEETSISSLTAGRKVVIFGLPGAYTSTCSASHVPSFMRTKDQFASKGVAEIICVSVNDVFVMHAWGQSANADHLMMLADGNGDFTKAVGLELDGTGFGMGTRSKRFAMIVDDGVVSLLNVDAGALEGSSAEAILAAL